MLTYNFLGFFFFTPKFLNFEAKGQQQQVVAGRWGEFPLFKIEIITINSAFLNTKFLTIIRTSLRTGLRIEMELGFLAARFIGL
jgi:hypothetical protein